MVPTLSAASLPAQMVLLPVMSVRTTDGVYTVSVTLTILSQPLAEVYFTSLVPASVKTVSACCGS